MSPAAPTVWPGAVLFRYPYVFPRGYHDTPVDQPTAGGNRLDSDPATQERINEERRVAFKQVLGLIPTRAWLSHPNNIRTIQETGADTYCVAHELGMPIVDVMVGNHWGDIEKIMPERITFSAIFSPILCRGSDIYVARAQPLQNDQSHLPLD